MNFCNNMDGIMMKFNLHKVSEIAPDSYLEAPRDPYAAAAYPGGDYPAPHPEYPSHPLPYQEQWPQVSDWLHSYRYVHSFHQNTMTLCLFFKATLPPAVMLD